jgi:hypothetical protein
MFVRSRSNTTQPDNSASAISAGHRRTRHCIGPSIGIEPTPPGSQPGVQTTTPRRPCLRQESNLRPPGPQPGALSTAPRRRVLASRRVRESNSRRDDPDDGLASRCLTARPTLRGNKKDRPWSSGGRRQDVQVTSVGGSRDRWGCCCAFDGGASFPPLPVSLPSTSMVPGRFPPRQPNYRLIRNRCRGTWIPRPRIPSPLLPARRRHRPRRHCPVAAGAACPPRPAP